MSRLHNIIRSAVNHSAAFRRSVHSTSGSILIKDSSSPFNKNLRLLRDGHTNRQILQKMGLSSSLLDSSQGQLVTEAIKSDCVVIFSKTTCGFCQMAKRVFSEAGVAYSAIELNTRADGQQIQDVLTEITGETTVPRVFINAKCIGGGSETRELYKRGKLLDLVKECQAKKLQSNL